MTLPSIHDSLDPIAVEIPEDTKYIGDRMDKLIALLTDIKENGIRRETPAPMIIELNLSQPIYRSSVRLRVQTIILSDNAGSARMRVMVGTRKYQFQCPTTTATQVLPFPLTIEAGVDIQGTGDAGAALPTDSRIYLIAYPDD